MKNNKYILFVFIGFALCFFVAYKSYLYNFYIVYAEEVEVKVAEINCNVRSGKTGSHSEIGLIYLEKRYQSLISKDLCYNLNIGDVIIMYYAKEINEFSDNREENKARLYIFSFLSIILLLLFIKNLKFKI